MSFEIKRKEEHLEIQHNVIRETKGLGSLAFICNYRLSCLYEMNPCIDKGYLQSGIHCAPRDSGGLRLTVLNSQHGTSPHV